MILLNGSSISFNANKKCYFIVIFKHRYFKIHKKFYKYLDHIAGVEYKFRRNGLASSLSLHIGMKSGPGIFFSLLEPSIPWLPMDTWLQGCNPARPVLVDRWWKETALYWYTSSSKKLEIKLYFYVANFSTLTVCQVMHTVVSLHKKHFWSVTVYTNNFKTNNILDYFKYTFYFSILVQP